MNYTDTYFFTNRENSTTLLEKLDTILANKMERFDVLVGFFFATGFYEVSEKVVKYPAEKSAGYKGLNPKCHAGKPLVPQSFPCQASTCFGIVSASNKIRCSKTLKESAEEECRLQGSKIQGDKNLSW